jgi:hypothetical protein
MLLSASFQKAEKLNDVQTDVALDALKPDIKKRLMDSSFEEMEWFFRLILALSASMC